MTVQARTANAEFLADAPPPAGGAAAVCLVDTGADVNPDTRDSLVERHALGEGDGGDVHRSHHGTRMAMLMGGRSNGWGSVGIWPHARIVSVRAMPAGSTTFPFHAYEQAIVLCSKRRGPAGVGVINLSLGSAHGTEHELARLRDRATDAHREGISLVAAAGNDGGPVEYPAAAEPVLSVGASTSSGALCDFSARGPGLDLAAPGCGLDGAFADGRPARSSGTSDAAAIASVILAALRSYRPDLGPEEAERLILDTGRAGADGVAIDAAAAFRAAGLDAIVERGRPPSPAPDPHPQAVPEEPGTVPGHAAPPRPARPRVRWRGGHLVVRSAARPAGLWLAVRVTYAARGEFRERSAQAESPTRVVRVRVPRRWRRVEVRYRDAAGISSAPLLLRRRR